MRNQSTVFAEPTPDKDELNLKRKRGAGSANRGTMGSILAHNEGPGSSKIQWASKTQRLNLTVKPQEQSSVQLNRSTLEKVITAKRDAMTASASKNTSMMF